MKADMNKNISMDILFHNLKQLRYLPNIDSIILHKVGKVRRAKLYYLRERSGKSARIQEKRISR